MRFVKILSFASIPVILLFAGIAHADDSTQADYQEVNWQAVSSGGTVSSDNDISLSGTAGQSTYGFTASDAHIIHSGFRQTFGPFYVCGDASGDEIVNVSDAVWLINYIFIGDNPPDPYKAGDANCDEIVNISDAVWIINYIFVGGNVPCDVSGDGIPEC